MTPDPYQASASTSNPQSWNRYAYVNGDPANGNDPTGLYLPLPSGSTGDWDYGGSGASGGLLAGGADGGGVAIDPGWIVLSSVFIEIGVGGGGGSAAAPAQQAGQLTCSITLYERGVAHTGGAFTHTYLDVSEVSASQSTDFNDVLEGGPQFPHNFLRHPKAAWGNLEGFEEPVPPPGTVIKPNTFFLGTTNPYKNTVIGSETGGLSVCAQITNLLANIDIYNAALLAPQSPYSLWPSGSSRNSNSFTYTLLNNIGLSSVFSPFVSNAPGWGMLVPGL
jgi:hypothetical protein